MKIPCIKSFKFLGYRFTHKSKLLPKSIVNYDKRTYCPPLRTSEKIQKFINRLFSNYLVETEKQHRYRTHWCHYEYDAFNDFVKKIKMDKLKDVNLSNDEIKKIDTSPWSEKMITYLRKLYDEGRLGKPLE